MLKINLSNYTRLLLLCVIVCMMGVAPAYAQKNARKQQKQMEQPPQPQQEMEVPEATEAPEAPEPEAPEAPEAPETLGAPEAPAPATGAAAYSDQDVMQFVQVAGEMSSIVQASEKEMIEVIKNENLEIEKFNEIMEARQSADTDKINATAEEITAFNNAAMKVIEIQNEMRAEMQKAIVRQGMDVAKFQEMMMAYQQDPEFQNKVNQLLGE